MIGIEVLVISTHTLYTLKNHEDSNTTDTVINLCKRYKSDIFNYQQYFIML